MIDSIFVSLWNFAHYDISGVLVCRLVAPLVLFFMLLLSRFVQSVAVKFLSIFIALLVYFFPDIINLFVVAP